MMLPLSCPKSFKVALGLETHIVLKMIQRQKDSTTHPNMYDYEVAELGLELKTFNTKFYVYFTMQCCSHLFYTVIEKGLILRSS